MTKQMTKLTNKELRVRALNSRQLTRCSKIEQGIRYKKNCSPRNYVFSKYNRHNKLFTVRSSCGTEIEKTTVKNELKLWVKDVECKLNVVKDENTCKQFRVGLIAHGFGSHSSLKYYSRWTQTRFRSSFFGWKSTFWGERSDGRKYVCARRLKLL